MVDKDLLSLQDCCGVGITRACRHADHGDQSYATRELIKAFRATMTGSIGLVDLE